MSQSAITTAFENYLAEQVAGGEPVILDRFIFANVPGLDPDAPIDRATEVVPVDNVVCQQDVTLPGLINENEVVYSVTLGTDVGDFDFNWIGLVNKSSGLLAMVTHAPTQQKFKNADGQQGNTLTRSFLMEYDGAATATNITTPAETWQIDFTARLAGMDDRERLENTDIYGDGAFFDDGFLITGNPTEGYQITAGVGYVGGLRVSLSTTQTVAINSRPTMVWVDACWKGDLTSVWKTVIGITMASALENYVDAAGLQHYVFAVASIDVNGAITDLRPKGSKDGQQLTDFLRIDQNLGEIAAKGEEAQAHSLNNLGCGTAAVADVQESSDDVTTSRVLVNGSALALRTVRAKAGETIADANDLPANSVSFCYADAAHSPDYEATILDVGGMSASYRVQYAASYADGGKQLKFRTLNGDNGAWGDWTNVLTNYGGSVAYLDNATYYKTNPAGWEGAGGFGDQYQNNAAPFLIPNGYQSPSGQSIYLPIIKAFSTTAGHGYGTAVSFGTLRYGTDSFGRAVINLTGDAGNSASFEFDISGQFNAPGNIIAGQGLFESNGAVRVYSSNNPPPNPGNSGFGGVDTYAFLSCNTAQSNGGVVAGSSLYSSGVGAQSNSWGDKSIVQQGTTMSGMWKCCGNNPAQDGADVGATLYYRIS